MKNYKRSGAAGFLCAAALFLGTGVLALGTSAFNALAAEVSGQITSCKITDDKQNVEIALNSSGSTEGTDGKGSVCAMLAALGRSSGLKTGMFTSPHLVDFRERIRVNGVMIPEDALLRLLVEVRDLVAEWDPHPTFFELALAVALKYFKECGVKFLVLETGLGGRLDATNAVPKDLAVLAPIGMDHQQYLGDTLELIAAEKAGIITAGRPVVSAVQEPEVAGSSAQSAASQFPVSRTGASVQRVVLFYDDQTFESFEPTKR